MSIFTSIFSSSANKEKLINENNLLTEAIYSYGAIAFNLTQPPSQPSPYGVYLIAASGASGAWVTQENNIALWTPADSSGYWKFYQPQTNMKVISISGSDRYIYDGTQWSLVS